MLGKKERILSVEEAAKIIYTTGSPTTAQHWRVQKRLLRGVLKGTKKAGPRGPRWTTTTSDVADYLASQASTQPSSSRAYAGDVPEGLRETVYKDLLKEYFLSLIDRRRASRASKRFQRLVVAGQVFSLLLLVVLGVSAFGRFGEQAATAHLPVAQWIAEHEGEFQVSRWHAPEPNPNGDGTLIRVEYRYFTRGHRGVETDRLFFIEDDRVVNVESR